MILWIGGTLYFKVMKKVILTICVVILNTVYALCAGDIDANFYRVVATDGAIVYNSPDSTLNDIIGVIHRGDIVRLYPTYDAQIEKDWKCVSSTACLSREKKGYVKVIDFEYCYTEYDGSYSLPESTKTLYDDIIAGTNQLLLPYCPTNVLMYIIYMLCIAIVFFLMKTEFTQKNYCILQGVFQIILLLLEFYLLNNEYEYIGMPLSIVVIVIQLLNIIHLFNIYSQYFKCKINWKWMFLPFPIIVFILLQYLTSEYNGSKMGISSNIIFVPQIIFIGICVLLIIISCRKTNKIAAYITLPVFYILTTILLTYLIGRMCDPLLMGVESVYILLYIIILIIYKFIYKCSCKFIRFIKVCKSRNY